MTLAALAAIALLSCAHARRPRERFPALKDEWDDEEIHGVCRPASRFHGQRLQSACTMEPREVTAFGATIPREEVPNTAICPMRVRAFGDRVVAEPLVWNRGFDALPFFRCPDFVPIARHALPIDDGWLVAEVGMSEGELVWTNLKGDDERRIARGRFVGFAKAPSGAILTLGIGRAHLGRGAVLKLTSVEGRWRAEMIAVLPVEPTSASFDDRGALVGYGERFVFRVDETGHVENLFYVSRDLGHVASIARTTDGTVYLGVECGVLKVNAQREEWWSARDGASGQWTSCAK